MEEEQKEVKKDSTNEIKKELQNGVKIFISKFLLGFGIRAGIGVLSRIAHLAINNPKELRSLNAIFGEKKLIFREEAVRLGCFLGTFSSLHSTINSLLTLYFQKNNNKNLQKFTITISGLISSTLSVLFLQRNTRLTFALYTFVRALQILTYKLDELHIIQPYLSLSFPPSFNVLIGSEDRKKRLTIYELIKYHFGALVFILSSAQIMYAYVMRKETLPSSYHAFIVKMGPIPANLLLCARHIADRNFPLPLSQIRLEGRLRGYEEKVPCTILHAHYDSCIKFVSAAWLNTFKKSFLMYLSIHLVSTLFFSYRRLFTKPASSLLHLFLAVVRSSSFLGAFVLLYQYSVCLYGTVFEKDHKFKYYISGIISSLAILMEKRSRREELGLYTLPYAFDSFRQLYSNYFSVFQKSKFGDILIYSLSMTILLHFYHLSPSLLPNVVRSAFNKVLLSGSPPKQNDNRNNNNNPPINNQ